MSRLRTCPLSSFLFPTFQTQGDNFYDLKFTVFRCWGNLLIVSSIQSSHLACLAPSPSLLIALFLSNREYVPMTTKVTDILAAYRRLTARYPWFYRGASDSWNSWAPAKSSRLLPITTKANPMLLFCAQSALVLIHASLRPCERAFSQPKRVLMAYLVQSFALSGRP